MRRVKLRRVVKQTLDPKPFRGSIGVEALARKSIVGTTHAFLQDLKWEPMKGGGWRVDCYFVDVQGSILIIYRQWEIPLRF